MNRSSAGSFLQTALARWLLVWMASSLVLVLAIGRLCEWLPGLPVLAAATGLVLLPAPIFLVWCGKALLRRPQRDWPGMPLLLAYGIAIVIGFDTLMTAGARLNYLSHQKTYERIIAEARAGILQSGTDGAVTGRLYGVTYLVQLNGRPTAQFEWGGSADGFFGILYDKQECFGGAPEATISTSTPASLARADGIEAPTMKNAGRLSGPKWRMSDEACLTHIVW